MPQKVYLKPKDFRQHSVVHTAYIGDGPVHPQGKSGEIYRLIFINGVARNVDETLYRRFKDAGIATDEKPAPPQEED